MFQEDGYAKAKLKAGFRMNKEVIIKHLKPLLMLIRIIQPELCQKLVDGAKKNL